MTLWLEMENYKWTTRHDKDANDDMHDFVVRHDAHSTEHIHWASFSLSERSCRFSFSHMHAPSLKFEPFMTFSWPSMWVRSFRLDPPFLPLALPPLFLILTYMKFMANLQHSAKEGVDTNDVLFLPTDKIDEGYLGKIQQVRPDHEEFFSTELRIP